jgi:GT2 family glycosyltransferase
MVPPTGRPELCDTLNANAVLVPGKVYSELGVFHDDYTHGMGDFDCGYQAGRRGARFIQSQD